MTPRTFFRLVRLGLIATGMLLVGFGLVMYAGIEGSSSGSPELAREWRAELSPLTDSDEAKFRDWRTFLIRFPSGEWVIARMQPSHGIWYRGGGTVVVKGSDGRVRAYFGHVCGANPSAITRSGVEDLETFYGAVPGQGFWEHHFE